MMSYLEPVAYKVIPLQGYVSRVFFVHCTAIEPSSPLTSTLYFLPKDQTLKQANK